MCSSDLAVFDARNAEPGNTAAIDRIVERFGTHFPYAVTYGSASKLVRTFTEAGMERRRESAEGFEESGGASLFGVSGNFQSIRDEAEAEAQSLGRSMERVECVAVGGIGSTSCESGATGDTAYPILLDLRPLDELLTPIHFPGETDIYGRVRTLLKARIIEYLKGHEMSLSATPVGDNAGWARRNEKSPARTL